MDETINLAEMFKSNIIICCLELKKQNNASRVVIEDEIRLIQIYTQCPISTKSEQRIYLVVRICI